MVSDVRGWGVWGGHAVLVCPRCNTDVDWLIQLEMSLQHDGERWYGRCKCGIRFWEEVRYQQHGQRWWVRDIPEEEQAFAALMIPPGLPFMTRRRTRSV